MQWQVTLARSVVDRLPIGATAQLVGSVTQPASLDAWSDVDVHLMLSADLDLSDLLGSATVWVLTETVDADSQLVRIVLADGHRLDLTVHGPGRLRHGGTGRRDDPRMLLVLAAVKLGRGDRLIGLHLLLEFLSQCLVSAMELRDRDEGTTIHRSGTARDVAAEEVTAVLAQPLDVHGGPGPIEAAAALYDRLRAEVDPAYQADWSGLTRLLADARSGPSEPWEPRGPTG